jgi:putative restriction endonuclease
MARVFGEIAGYPPGSVFKDRTALSESGVHRPPQAGISGAEDEGADSIVVSGGYEDDFDAGDYVIYTGQGGRDARTGVQTADQKLERGNKALARSSTDGLPVRVIRGAGGNPLYSPAEGLRYEGLFYVEDYWRGSGASGFQTWSFKLVETQDTGAITAIPEEPPETGPAPRVQMFAQRIVRNTQTANLVKGLHDYACQVCGTSIETSSGPYAEGAHIRPLGSPHDGPDVASNILCLCPNDHVAFDYGVIELADDLMVSQSGTRIGTLRTVPDHVIDKDHLSYHRSHIRHSDDA